jgi:hypothetical protein
MTVMSRLGGSIKLSFALKNRYWLLFFALLIASISAIFYLSSCGGWLVMGGDTTNPAVTTTTMPTGYTVSLLYKKTGVNASDYFGNSVSSAGDLNGDGKDDFMVGEMRYYSSPGYVHLYSGVDGSSLATLEGVGVNSDFGNAASSGDLDGDGKSDLIVSEPTSHIISIFYGDNLYNRTNISFPGSTYPGDAIACLGDINGDGGGDFVYGESQYSPSGMSKAGRVVVVSGKDRALIRSHAGTAADMWLGRWVASAGDVNGDGTTDYIAGAPYASPAGKSSAGSAYVYSGADGSLLFQKDGGASGDQFGMAVGGLGDVNGDGKSDFLVGAPKYDQPTKANIGTVYVYSGADGATLYQLTGEAARNEFGSALAGLWDIDGDGTRDFAVGAPLASPNNMQEAGAVYIYSGASGNLICRLDGEGGGLPLGKSGDNFGIVIAPAGDTNGDGKPEIIIGTDNYNTIGFSNIGAAYVYSIVKN